MVRLIKPSGKPLARFKASLVGETPLNCCAAAPLTDWGLGIVSVLTEWIISETLESSERETWKHTVEGTLPI